MSKILGSGGDESGSFLDLIRHFDWLKIPGAVRAIAHLVTGVGDAGAAWVDVAQAKGQQVAQEIRDRTAARKSIMAATAKAAGARAVLFANIMTAIRGPVCLMGGAAHGYEPTREAAMAAFAKNWRRE
jgi:hypothetical protein